MKPLISKQPATSILNPDFPYKSAEQTDVAETFRRIIALRLEQIKQEPSVVKPFKRRP